MKLAGLQLETMPFDVVAALAATRTAVERAAASGAVLAVMPESYLPAYPAIDRASTMGGRALGELMAEQAVTRGDEVCRALAAIARDSRIHLVAGVTERAGAGLYNAALVFGPDGSLLGAHRKLIPVLHEREYHRPGGAQDLRLVATGIGTLGLAICFENLHAPYRTALIDGGEDIHCALWVSVPADRHLVEVSARQHAIEAGVPVVAAGSVGSPPGGPVHTGGTLVVAPGGRVAAGSQHGDPDVVVGDIGDADAVSWRAAFDLRGEQRRDDLLEVRRARPAPIAFSAPVELDPARTALVLVDMQGGEVDPALGFVAAREHAMPGSTTAYVARMGDITIPACAALLACARELDMTVVHLMLGAASPALEDLHPRVADALVHSVKRELGVDLSADYAPGSPSFELVAPLAPRPGEIVLRKTTYGAFNSLDLATLLRGNGIESLVIGGVSTSACVDTTARDAADRGFGVVIVEPACGDWDPADHAASLRSFARLFGEVAPDVDTVMARLGGRAQASCSPSPSPSQSA